MARLSYTGSASLVLLGARGAAYRIGDGTPVPAEVWTAYAKHPTVVYLLGAGELTLEGAGLEPEGAGLEAETVTERAPEVAPEVADPLAVQAPTRAAADALPWSSMRAKDCARAIRNISDLPALRELVAAETRPTVARKLASRIRALENPKPCQPAAPL